MYGETSKANGCGGLPIESAAPRRKSEFGRLMLRIGICIGGGSPDGQLASEYAVTKRKFKATIY